MRLFNKVVIVGVGLIGGSLALAIKKKRLAKEVLGTSRHKKNLLIAKNKGAIDRGSQDIGIVRGADLVILSVPVNAIMDLAPLIAKHISADCIVCDVGSTKQQIVTKLDKIFPNYVGTHPLAGSEKRGILNSKVNIFKGSLCILTPTKNTNKDALLKVKKLWRSLGVRVVSLSSRAHDKIISFVSHLPHIVAFSLVNSVSKKYLGFASTGFKDTTRIAASDSELWLDIFFSNKKNLTGAIESFQRELARIKAAIERGDSETLNKILKQAKTKREKLNSTSNIKQR